MFVRQELYQMSHAQILFLIMYGLKTVLHQQGQSQLPLGASCCSWLPFCLSVEVFSAGPLTIVVPAFKSSLDRVELCAENSIKRRQSPYTLTLTVRLGLIWSHELPSWTPPPCLSELGWDNVSAICQQRTCKLRVVSKDFCLKIS